jgi:predicted nucleic-acid-binding protein
MLGKLEGNITKETMEEIIKEIDIKRKIKGQRTNNSGKTLFEMLSDNEKICDFKELEKSKKRKDLERAFEEILIKIVLGGSYDIHEFEKFAKLAFPGKKIESDERENVKDLIRKFDSVIIQSQQIITEEEQRTKFHGDNVIDTFVKIRKGMLLLLKLDDRQIEEIKAGNVIRIEIVREMIGDSDTRKETEEKEREKGEEKEKLKNIIKETINNIIIDNDYNCGYKNSSALVKFLEFQYFYNKELFESVIKNLIDEYKIRNISKRDVENNLKRIEKIKRLEAQIEFNCDGFINNDKNDFIKKQMEFLRCKELVNNKDIFLKKQIVLKFLYKSYTVTATIQSKVEEYQNKVDEQKKNNIDDIDLYWNLVNVECLNNLLSILSFNKYKFNKYLNDLRIKSVIESVVINITDNNHSLENKFNEEYLIRRTKTDRERVIKMFDMEIKKYQQAIERENKYRKNTEEYKDYSSELNTLSRLKERILLLSEFDGYRLDKNKASEISNAVDNIVKINKTEETKKKETEEDKIEDLEKNLIKETMVKLLNNDYGYNDKKLAVLVNFLEFQYFYNKELFESVINNLMPEYRIKNDLQHITNLRQLKAQIEINCDRFVEDNKNDFIEKQIEFLRYEEIINNKDIFPKKRIVLNFLYEEYNNDNGFRKKYNGNGNNNDNQSGRNFIKETVENKIKKYEIEVEEQRKNNINNIDLYWNLTNIKYLKHLHITLNYSKNEFVEYVENLRIISIIKNIMLKTPNADYLFENKSDEEFLVQKTKENKERITGAFDEVIKEYREATEREEKYNKDTKNYKDYSNELKILSKLKERILSLSELDNLDGGGEKEKIRETITRVLEERNDMENINKSNNCTNNDIKTIGEKEESEKERKEKNNEKRQNAFIKFLEFQYFYNKELFESVINNPIPEYRTKNNPQYVEKLKQRKKNNCDKFVVKGEKSD